MPVDSLLRVEVSGSEALRDLATEPQLSQEAAELLIAFAESTSNDPDATFSFRYLDVSGVNPDQSFQVFQSASVTYSTIDTNLGGLQKLAGSVQAQLDYDIDVLITPAGSGGTDHQVDHQVCKGTYLFYAPAGDLGPFPQTDGILTDGIDLIV